MIEKKIIVNNLLVNYYLVETKAPAASKTAVFLHGWRANAMIWLPVVKFLGGLGYNLIYMDLPGFGKSQTPPKEWYVSDYAVTVKALIEKLELQKVILVGHSFGGRVAIKLAIQFPSSVEKLVLVGSGGIRLDPYKRRLITSVAKVLKPAFALPLLKSLRPRIYYMLGAEDYLATPELKSTFINVIEENFAEYLPRINHKTLIVWGEKDQESPLKAAHIMHSKIPRSELVIFPNAGHFCFMDETEEFVKILLKFINDESV